MIRCSERCRRGSPTSVYQRTCQPVRSLMPSAVTEMIDRTDADGPWMHRSRVIRVGHHLLPSARGLHSSWPGSSPGFASMPVSTWGPSNGASADGCETSSVLVRLLDPSVDRNRATVKSRHPRGWWVNPGWWSGGPRRTAEVRLRSRPERFEHGRVRRAGGSGAASGRVAARRRRPAVEAFAGQCRLPTR